MKHFGQTFEMQTIKILLDLLQQKFKLGFIGHTESIIVY